MKTPLTGRERPPEGDVEPMPERVYRLLLRAYPAPFRAAYGREMTLLFRDQLRDTGAGLRLWSDIVRDVARSAPAAHADSFRARWTEHNLPREGVMRPMALFVMLAGVANVMNAMIEARAGWARERGAAWSSSILVAVIAGLLLGAAGIALLRHRPMSIAFARVFALLSLGAFASVGYLYPWASVFARLLGIGFPIVLVLFLFSPRGRGPTALAS